MSKPKPQILITVEGGQIQDIESDSAVDVYVWDKEELEDGQVPEALGSPWDNEVVTPEAFTKNLESLVEQQRAALAKQEE